MEGRQSQYQMKEQIQNPNHPGYPVPMEQSRVNEKYRALKKKFKLLRHVFFTSLVNRRI